MTFTPSIPQATDNPSQSQPLILSNFTVLNNIYGTNGDHYPWTDTAAGEVGLHAKVTMPGLPSANPPGNVLPTTAVGNLSIFAQTTTYGQAPTSVTQPYWRHDGLTTNIPLMPIKAFGDVTGAGAIVGTAYNFSVTSHTVGTGIYAIALSTNAVASTNVSVFVTTTSANLSTGQTQGFAYAAGILTFNVQTYVSGAPKDTNFSLMVLENA